MTCPTHPEHGRVYDLDDGFFFCPHQEHDKRGARTRSRFTAEEVLDGHVKAVPQPRKRGKRK